MRMIDRAAAHPLVLEGPSASFFEGGLIGNGAMGVVVYARPDALVFHMGHNAVWDQRVCEVHKSDILPFPTLFSKIKNISEKCQNLLEENEWYSWYNKRMQESYSQHSYPRPFPCGSLYLFLDMRKYEVMGYRVDIQCGKIQIRLRGLYTQDVEVTAFVDMEQDVLYVYCKDMQGAECQPFTSVRMIPHDDPTEPKFPAPQWSDGLSFRQRLPAHEDLEPSQEDNAFSVRTCLSCLGSPDVTEGRLALPEGKLEVSVSIRYGRDDLLKNELEECTASYVEAERRTKAAWSAYWACSGIEIEQKDLEEIWYHNQYFLRLVLRKDTVCPGLFGNFLYGRYGTEWHNDYHMNYNTQQLFWSCFITNHIDLHEPYIELVEKLLPLSKAWAREQYGLPGAYFPHSAYPVPMSTFPYPTTVWGWELCETPWAVQSLWWHYLYTRDKEFLDSRLFEPIRQSVLFLCAYMQRPEADFGDGCYHVFPTVAPELYTLRPNFTHNADCVVDLALIRFLFQAYLQAVDILEKTEEGETVTAVREILEHFPEYPRTEGQDGVLLNVAASDPDEVQNTPNTLVPVFPGEDSRFDEGENRELAIRSWRRMLVEGGNELVFSALQAARLGILDLEAFVRHVRYNQHPNGTLSDRVICSGGRYEDARDFDFMRFMGVWVENFSIPAVISNCLIHGHGEKVRLFPNWDLNKEAAFSGHRVNGAFLVSASCGKGCVQEVSVHSEKGGEFCWLNPWTHQEESLHFRPGEEKLLYPFTEIC